MVSNLNTISQIGKLPQIEVNIKNIWNQHLSIYLPHSNLFSCCVFLKHISSSSSQTSKGRKPLCHPHVDNVASRGLFQTYNSSNGWNLEGNNKQTGINSWTKNELAMVILYFFCFLRYIINARKMIPQYCFLGCWKNHSRNHRIDIFITIWVNMWKAITRVENDFGFKHLYILKLF